MPAEASQEPGVATAPAFLSDSPYQFGTLGIGEPACRPSRIFAPSRAQRRRPTRTGAAPATAMTHIAIQEELDGKVVEWMEHVSGEQYRKSSVTAGPRIPHPENLR